jgi:hypothetical protein
MLRPEIPVPTPDFETPGPIIGASLQLPRIYDSRGPGAGSAGRRSSPRCCTAKIQGQGDAR